jgi:HlyD family secretion protein
MQGKTFAILAVALVTATVALFALSRDAAQQPAPAASPLALQPETIAGPGRVEPLSEEIQISAAIGGRLAQVPVEEGQRIAAGQILAVIENADFRARVLSAEATLAQRQAALRRVINGARSQERREALAEMKAAEAHLENARLEMQRRRTGYEQGVFSKEESDRATRELGVAQGRYDAARERYQLLEAEAREEDRARAEAEVALARAQLEEARALLEKTILRSPLRGVVLRKHRKAGESVSTQFDSPILTIADDSVLRVRVDVDESDVGRLRLGQRAWVIAEAFPGQKFTGRVVRIGQLLGKKNVRTDEPAERVDRKILETLIELDGHPPLPLGLRVDAFLRVAGS